MSRTYSEAMTLDNFMERYKCLKCTSRVGEDTFGPYRYLYEEFLRSQPWKQFRNDIIVRDNGCDLGFDGHEIFSKATIHHIEPITLEDFLNRSPKLLDPENAILVCHNTHMAIHYGDEYLLMNAEPAIRTPNDTTLW